jgi:hypothetical protein
MIRRSLRGLVAIVLFLLSGAGAARGTDLYGVSGTDGGQGGSVYQDSLGFTAGQGGFFPSTQMQDLSTAYPQGPSRTR